MKNILLTPYTMKELSTFKIRAMQNEKRVEFFGETAFALSEDEKLLNGEILDRSNDEDYKALKLRQAKNAKLEENEKLYNEAFKAGVVLNAVRYDCDDLATLRITGQAALLNENETVTWFDYDYNPQTLSYQAFMTLAGLVALRTREIESENCRINTTFSNATTIEQVEAIRSEERRVGKECRSRW